MSEKSEIKCPNCKSDHMIELTELICSDTKKIVYTEYQCNECGTGMLIDRDAEIAYFNKM